MGVLNPGMECFNQGPVSFFFNKMCACFFIIYIYIEYTYIYIYFIIIVSWPYNVIVCVSKMSPHGVRCAGWICSEQSDRGLKEPVGLAPGGLFDGDGGEGCWRL